MKNLLVIDKAERNIYKMKSFSKKYGLELFEAHNGLEALNQLKSHQDIDIVLIDVNLDNEDGFDLVEKIRDDHNTLPIIILTTLNSKKDFVHGLKVGATDYLLKPFDEEIFVKRVMNPSKLRVTSSPGHIDTVDIKTLIHAELVKAQKGRYAITFGVAQYFNANGETSIDIDTEYNNVLTRFYPGLKSIFWETDFILRYGNQTFVFVLPFCAKAELPVVKRKLHAFGDNFFSHNDLHHYKLISAFLSFPSDEETDYQVVDELIDRINKLKHKELTLMRS
jgi:DNA-binding response OmpR family regulator